MSDIYSEQKRSEIMSRVAGKDTAPEVLVRKALFARGFRYRKNVKSMYGKPDLVLFKYRVVVFVHGCFWHGHKRCKSSRLPTTHAKFWRKKIADNIKRDLKHISALQHESWRVAIIWECALSSKDITQDTISSLESWVLSNSVTIEIPKIVKYLG